MTLDFAFHSFTEKIIIHQAFCKESSETEEFPESATV